MDGRTDGWTEGWMDGRTDGWILVESLSVATNKPVFGSSSVVKRCPEMVHGMTPPHLEHFLFDVDNLESGR